MDIGCGAGDLLLYCEINFKINEVIGINYFNERHLINYPLLNRYNIKIFNIDALKYIYNYDNSDVFWLWIEEPKIEIELLKLIQNAVVNHEH